MSYLISDSTYGSHLTTAIDVVHDVTTADGDVGVTVYIGLITTTKQVMTNLGR